MKTIKIVASLLTLWLVSGCAVVPVAPGYYPGPPAYYDSPPVYYGPPIYFVPSFEFGFYGGGGRGHGGRR